MGYTDMALLSLEKTHPLYNNLQRVLKSAHRAKDLVEQILLFSKQAEKERYPLKLQTLIKEALKLLRPTIPSTIQIKQEIDTSCSKILADATQMHQVIINLCTNAWHAMENNGGTLSIELTQHKSDMNLTKLLPDLTEEEYVCLSIIDTGSGMDNAILERIFEPFYTTKAVDKGTGLGLSVVHGIVRNHGGDIQVETIPGKGTTFRVYLPAIRDSLEKAKVDPTEIPGGNEYIMIVDDEPTIAVMIKRMLESFGYRADTFETGQEVLEAQRENPKKYDLLITDLTMPELSGLDLADKLHEQSPLLPIMIMTGFGDSLTAASRERYGIKAVIGKPVSTDKLIRTIHNILK
jgi:CheY-like chemotaxis protein/two-component sensor histidine kinase